MLTFIYTLDTHTHSSPHKLQIKVLLSAFHLYKWLMEQKSKTPVFILNINIFLWFLALWKCNDRQAVFFPHQQILSVKNIHIYNTILIAHESSLVICNIINKKGSLLNLYRSTSNKNWMLKWMETDCQWFPSIQSFIVI